LSKILTVDEISEEDKKKFKKLAKDPKLADLTFKLSFKKKYLQKGELQFVGPKGEPLFDASEEDEDEDEDNEDDEESDDDEDQRTHIKKTKQTMAKKN